MVRKRRKPGRVAVAVSIVAHVFLVGTLWAGVTFFAPPREPDATFHADVTTPIPIKDPPPPPIKEPPPEVRAVPTPAPTVKDVPPEKMEHEPLVVDRVRPATSLTAISIPSQACPGLASVPPAAKPVPAREPSPAPVPVAIHTDPPPAPPAGPTCLASPVAGNAAPIYPPRAVTAGFEGVVLLTVEVEPDGSVGAVHVSKSSGHPVLDRAAMCAVRGWHFHPALDRGVAVKGTVQVPIRFRLQ